MTIDPSRHPRCPPGAERTILIGSRNPAIVTLAKMDDRRAKGTSTMIANGNGTATAKVLSGVFVDEGVRRKFSAAVVDALIAYAPNAFGTTNQTGR
jgi:hypothetical protein